VKQALKHMTTTGGQNNIIIEADDTRSEKAYPRTPSQFEAYTNQMIKYQTMNKMLGLAGVKFPTAKPKDLKTVFVREIIFQFSINRGSASLPDMKFHRKKCF
jgi:hypothetical protein